MPTIPKVILVHGMPPVACEISIWTAWTLEWFVSRDSCSVLLSATWIGIIAEIIGVISPIPIAHNAAVAGGKIPSFNFNDFWNIPGLIHYMTPIQAPYVSPLLTDTIVYWLRQHIITGITETSNSTNNISIHYDHHTAIVSSESENISSITIYDMMGRTLMNIDKINSKHFTLNTEYFLNGIYIVAILHNNQQMNKKIILK